MLIRMAYMRENDFSEWMFKRILGLASGRVVKIKVVFDKIEKGRPEKRRKTYIGVIGEEETLGCGRGHLITIEPRISERSKIRVFCHELLHILFDVVQSESAIEKIEDMLWRSLSERQKQLLKKYMYQRARMKIKKPAL